MIMISPDESGLNDEDDYIDKMILMSMITIHDDDDDNYLTRLTRW